MLTLVEQLSVAVARPVFVGSSELLHSTIALVGQVRTGGIVSSTVNLCVASPKLPHSSVTRYTRVIVPGQRPTSPPSLGQEEGSVRLHGLLALSPAAREAPRLADGA